MSLAKVNRKIIRKKKLEEFKLKALDFAIKKEIVREGIRKRIEVNRERIFGQR